MGEKMTKLMKKINKRPVLWLVVLVVLLATAATVYAVLPVISLNSPTSFPVDI
jgi:TRAP-type C4-dicarboxylate transport system permease large subunit